mmetsp:Transcript_4445/g.10295  ORF Transcript_4445/g.10295 Transcript_4445/m.10295 type:complete len:459 (+) Transcript_4445:62-1438(+)|eukprot:CAMPEP_0170594416 /NCGR_PEP_ID=MMETSP0224-20130122/13992_1 /TAXON_ID=285029 /ORGANISM="Togula jolla, Strain CCCM 725" /LENGTH=458 /DNA_ID=CAMNT_0010918479 /DNA_START=65 /DNA_END=1441 /DNA_ORIENTATION=-
MRGNQNNTQNRANTATTRLAGDQQGRVVLGEITNIASGWVPVDDPDICCNEERISEPSVSLEPVDQLQEAVLAVQEALRSQGPESEWIARLAAKLNSLGPLPSNVLDVLGRHGWASGLFNRSLSRNGLMQDLLRARDGPAAPSAALVHSASTRTLGLEAGAYSSRASSSMGSAAGSASVTVHSPIQEAEADDPQLVSEYATDIMSNLFNKEADRQPLHNYMATQRDINARMRAILVDWVVEVHMKYKLSTVTLFLSVRLIDRYLSKVSVTRTRLQLVGVAAMFIASKYEELKPPTIEDFCYIAAGTYTQQEVLKAECAMLSKLDFIIACPTPAHFAEFFFSSDAGDEVQRELAQYLMELALVDYRVNEFLPSVLAAACKQHSRHLLRREPAWPVAEVQRTRYTDNDLLSCTTWLDTLLQQAPTSSLEAVRRKFSSSKHRSVATLWPAPVARGAISWHG